MSNIKEKKIKELKNLKGKLNSYTGHFHFNHKNEGISVQVKQKYNKTIYKKRKKQVFKEVLIRGV